MEIEKYLKDREYILKKESCEIIEFLKNNFDDIKILNFCNYFSFEAIVKNKKSKKINRFFIVNNRILMIKDIFKSYKFQSNGVCGFNTTNIIDFDNELIRINFNHSKYFKA